jgi:hypothetical protein
VVPASCLDGSGLLLPAEFREAVVPETGRFTLQNAEGKTWPCTITRKQQGGHSRADITGGWRPFAKQNALQAGDEIHVTYLGKGVIKASAPLPAPPAARWPPALRTARPAPPSRGALFSFQLSRCFPEGLASLLLCMAALALRPAPGTVHAKLPVV